MDESLQYPFLFNQKYQAKHQRNERTMTTSTAMRAIMISSIECVDDCVAEREN